MNLLKKIFDFYIKSSIHVSLAVCAFTAVTAMEYHLNLSDLVWSFIFFGSITGYNFVKYYRVDGQHDGGLTASLKTIQIFSFICAAILLWIILHLSFATLLATFVFGMLTFLYAVPLTSKINLRKISGIKVFVVATVWGGTSVIIPVVAAEHALTTDIWISFIQRILMMVALMIPFEIRDLPYDSSALETIPQQFGVLRSKLFGIFLLVLILGMEIFKDERSPAYLWSLIIISPPIILVLWSSKRRQGRYFASFWVEALPIAWFLIYGLLASIGK